MRIWLSMPGVRYSQEFHQEPVLYFLDFGKLVCTGGGGRIFHDKSKHVRPVYTFWSDKSEEDELLKIFLMI